MKKIKKLLRILSFGSIVPLYQSCLKIMSRFHIKKILKKHTTIKLDIGAGAHKGANGWTTLDMNTQCDIFWDLRDGIPFPENSIHVIYSSHLLEHLTFKEIEILIEKCKKALKQGGIFSVCVPNARLFIEQYVNKNEKYLESLPAYYKPAYCNPTRMDVVNYIAYMNGEHKYMFDEENLLYILNKAGFKKVRLRQFDSEMDIPEREHESIYAEGIKEDV